MNQANDRLSQFFAELPNFDTLSEGDRLALVMAVELRQHAGGDRIISQGDKGDGAYFVLSGEVRVELERDSGTQEVGRMTTGALFGVLAMVDHRPRSASCIADGDVDVAFLSRPAFEMLAHRQASIAYPFQRAVGAQVASDFRQVVGRVRDHLES
jgi:CRP-like cAMP-binding protein